jgi:hypothetical protein
MKGSRKAKKDQPQTWAQPLKLPVSRAALMGRINRKLAAEMQKLKVPRSDRWRSDLGDYYIVDEHRNTIEAAHVDPVALARELGVLKPWEAAEV